MGSRVERQLLLILDLKFGFLFCFFCFLRYAVLYYAPWSISSINSVECPWLLSLLAPGFHQSSKHMISKCPLVFVKGKSGSKQGYPGNRQLSCDLKGNGETRHSVRIQKKSFDDKKCNNIVFIIRKSNLYWNILSTFLHTISHFQESSSN